MHVIHHRSLIHRFGLAAFLVTVGLGAAAPRALADSLPAGEFGERVEVSEVLLDVLVTDRQGQVVLGLDSTDFVVEDAGREVIPTGTSFYSNRFQVRDGEEGIQHPAPNEVLADRHFVLFFHDQTRDVSNTGLYIRNLVDAVRESRKWVESEMLPGDWVSVMSYDHKLKVHSDFTQDRQRLLRALDNVVRGKDPGNIWGPGRTEPGPEGHTLLARLPERRELRRQTTRIYGALRLVADATRDVAGRKSLLLFTLGFGDLRATGNLSGAVLASGVRSQPDRRFYPALEQALNDNNVAVYPIHMIPGASRAIQADFLSQLAGDSGGSYVQNFVNFIAPLREIADEQNGYYLLSYEAQHGAGETGYRSVRVKTRNPEFRVRARKGYRFGA